jgi:hypothetical protein
MTPDPVDADVVAIEHLLWAREQGCSPADVLASVGVGWPCRRPPSWDDAQFVLAIRWRRLRRQASQTGESGAIRCGKRNSPKASRNPPHVLC